MHYPVNSLHPLELSFLGHTMAIEVDRNRGKAGVHERLVAHPTR